jgi:hypothetical protein
MHIDVSGKPKPAICCLWPCLIRSSENWGQNYTLPLGVGWRRQNYHKLKNMFEHNKKSDEIVGICRFST